MSRLFIVGIAINEYPNPKHCLSGCVNDRDAFLNYFETHYTETFDSVSALTLTNEEATRDAVIKAFEHFHQADDDDTCVVFYAGHGSQMPAPVKLSHLESDNKLETIVCHDSRTAESSDLLDKELSYLIWEATAKREKHPHFVVIMDCCHSGGNTRTEHVTEEKARMLKEVSESISHANILGIEHFHQDKEGRLFPPRAEHILLSAAHSHQTAKEIKIASGTHRGAFTYCLLQILESSVDKPSYQILMDKTIARVRRLVKEQTPLLETTKAAARNLVFLSKVSKQSVAAHNYVLSYNPIDKWFVNAGTINGLSSDLMDHPMLFRSLSDDVSLSATQVFADRTLIEGVPEDYNKLQGYEVVLAKANLEKLKINFDRSVDAEVVNQLQLNNTKLSADLLFIEHQAQSGNGPYLIKQEGETLQLIDISYPTPFLLGEGPTTSPELFVKQLLKIKNRQHLLGLTPELAEQLPLGSYKIDIYQRTPASVNNYQAVPTAQLLELSYAENSAASRPAIKVKITNESRYILWFTAFYIGEDYSITDELLTNQRLAPREEVWLQNAYAAPDSLVLEFVVREELLRRGHFSCIEQLKIIASTKPISGSSLNQSALFDAPIRAGSNYRGYQRRVRPVGASWDTTQIDLRISKAP